MVKSKGFKTGRYQDHEALPFLQSNAHAIARDHGFWEGPEQDNVPTKIALIHEEVSEALKDFREGRMSVTYDYSSPKHPTRQFVPLDWKQELDGTVWWRPSRKLYTDVVPWQPTDDLHHVLTYAGYVAKPEGFPIELADAVIRIMDLAERLGIDLAEMINLKMAYNSTREYMHGRRV